MGATRGGSTGDLAPPRGRAVRGISGEITVHYRDRRRGLSVLAALLVAGLLAFAIQGPWWQMNLISSSESPTPTQVQSSQAQFSLDGAIRCSVAGWYNTNTTPCTILAPTASGLGGLLDGVSADVLWVLIGAALGAGGLLALALAGAIFGRWQLTVATDLMIVLAIGILVVAILPVALGPGPQAASYCRAWSSTVSSCGFFWGGTSVAPYAGGCGACATVFNWGAGLSWFAAVAAGGIALLSAYALRVGRKGPFTKDEQLAWARQLGYVTRPTATPTSPARGAASPGAATPSAVPFPGVAIAPHSVGPEGRTPWSCPRCGLVNAPWSQWCGRCRGAKPGAAGDVPAGGGSSFSAPATGPERRR
jgi:hypothetical protein